MEDAARPAYSSAFPKAISQRCGEKPPRLNHRYSSTELIAQTEIRPHRVRKLHHPDDTQPDRQNSGAGIMGHGRARRIRPPAPALLPGNRPPLRLLRHRLPQLSRKRHGQGKPKGPSNHNDHITFPPQTNRMPPPSSGTPKSSTSARPRPSSSWA
jgi:hypothetical protein